MTLALTACGCQHMAPAVMLGNTSDCHVMRCSTRCWGHTAGRTAYSPYLLLNRICTHSRSVLMSSVSFMKASHFSIKTQEVQVRATQRQDPMPSYLVKSHPFPAALWTPPAEAVPQRQPYSSRGPFRPLSFTPQKPVHPNASPRFPEEPFFKNSFTGL